MNGRTLLLKTAAVFLGGAALLAAGTPLGLYWLGLSNIEGRPKPPTRANSIPAEVALLREEFGSDAPVEVRVLNPWIYAASLMAVNPNNLRLDNGAHAVWLIASNYNERNLKVRKMSYWHLSGAALMIWVSRNWTNDQIVTAAANIVRSRYPKYDSSSLVEIPSIAGLPPNLSTLLGYRWKCCGMVDVGEEFYPTDVVGGPERQFVVAGLSKESALIAYEWGNGWERGFEAAAYVYGNPRWHLIARWNLGARPNSLAQLIAETNESAPGTNQGHYFDKEPDLHKPELISEK
jgi:hypothetical protein